MNKRRLIKRLLLTVLALALTAMVIIFVSYRQVTQNPEVLLSQIKEEADMHLSKIRQTATKNGIREWRMEAESASLVNKKKTMLLVNPNVEVFMTDGDNVHLTADEGIIYTDSNRLAVSGNVVAKTRLYQFRTESVVYDPDTRELRSDTPITVSSESVSLKANTMTMKLSSRITFFEGGVEGTISEDFKL
ncbi:conserved uncharacterized protein, Lipopolysccharide-assembly, LptC-related [Desulfosarcina variabilis str. Montpellier]|uniref:LPS export ABC transporter periplasmic protein LptC n=1 Tax=Desulfosarcina variabilis TaxID=2300 RepID=UPI003AFA7572